MPVVRNLESARLYLCTDSRRRQGDLADFLDAVLANGVDIVQLREKNLEAADELDAARGVRRRLPPARRAAGGQRPSRPGGGRRRGRAARRPAGSAAGHGPPDSSDPDVTIGLSSHSVEQAGGGRQHPDVDYFCVGPVWATPTKPGRPRHRAASRSEPWPSWRRTSPGSPSAASTRTTLDRGAGGRRPPGGRGAGADRGRAIRARPRPGLAARRLDRRSALCSVGNGSGRSSRAGWFEHAHVRAPPTSSLATLRRAKAATDQTVSVVIPARNEAGHGRRRGRPDPATPGAEPGLVDELVVIDSDSTDDTAASGPAGRRHGVRRPRDRHRHRSRCRARARRCGSRCS